MAYRTTAKIRLANMLDDMSRRTTATPQDRLDYADELVNILADMVQAAAATWAVTTAGSATNQAGRLTQSTIS